MRYSLLLALIPLGFSWSVELVAFALDAWTQWEALVRDEVSRACADRDEALQPPALLARILDDRHKIERYQHVAVAELVELLGDDATRKLLSNIEPLKVQLPEPDYLWVAREESSSEYLGRICTQLDPENLRRNAEPIDE